MSSVNVKNMIADALVFFMESGLAISRPIYELLTTDTVGQLANDLASIVNPLVFTNPHDLPEVPNQRIKGVYLHLMHLRPEQEVPATDYHYFESATAVDGFAVRVHRQHMKAEYRARYPNNWRYNTWNKLSTRDGSWDRFVAVTHLTQPDPLREHLQLLEAVLILLFGSFATMGWPNQNVQPPAALTIIGAGRNRETALVTADFSSEAQRQRRLGKPSKIRDTTANFRANQTPDALKADDKMRTDKSNKSYRDSTGRSDAREWWPGGRLFKNELEYSEGLQIPR